MTKKSDAMPDHQGEVESQASPLPDALVPASPLRRLIAFLIDLIPVVASHLAIGGGRWGFAAIFSVYHSVSLAVFGRTLGKAATALKVQKTDGSRLGLLPAFLRSTIGYFASSFILLGFLHIFRDSRRRGWHDVLFGSEVVQQPGALTLKQLIRAIDDWTQQLDAWLDRVLARYKRIGKLFSLVLKLTGLVTLLRGWVEQFVGWILGHIKGTAAAAAPQTATGAAGTATGATATGAGTGALATVTSTITALVLTGATVITYQAVVPRPTSTRPGPALTKRLGKELLSNPGNEAAEAGQGPASWTVVAGSGWTTRTSDPEPKEGTDYFFAGDGPLGELSQDVDVSEYAAAIKAGRQEFRFEGYVRSWDQSPADSARIILEYRGRNNELVLGALDSGEITDTANWRRVSDRRFAPAGTGWIRVRLVSTRYNGSNNDGYFDALSLRAVER